MEDKDYHSVLNNHWEKIRLEKEKNKHKSLPDLYEKAFNKIKNLN